MRGMSNSALRIFVPVACVFAGTTVSAAPVDTRGTSVTRLLDEANRRTANGESADVVEQWLTQAMQASGMVTTAPDWDVYGQKRWRAAQDLQDTTPASTFVESVGRPPPNGDTADPPSFVSAPAVLTANP